MRKENGMEIVSYRKRMREKREGEKERERD